jgi:site-specific recombinase XerD
MEIATLYKKFTKYIIDVRGGVPATAHNYLTYLNMFSEITGVKLTNKITKKSIDDFKDRLLELDISKKTVNYYLIGLRVFIIFLHREKIPTIDVVDVERFKRLNDKKIDLIPKDELIRFLSAKISPTSDLLVNMLFATGLRIFELQGLNIEDLRGCTFSVRGKGGKDRIVFLDGDICTKLLEYVGERTSGPIFLNPQKNRISKRRLQAIVQERVIKLNLSKQFSAHTLRHHFATDLLENGADLMSVKDMLGHSSIATTQKYIHLSNKHLQNSHEKFHTKINVDLPKVDKIGDNIGDDKEKQTI